METEKTKCACYLRVSTDDQHPENQLMQLEKFAEGLGYEIAGKYTDYVSGGESNRPQFQLMMDHARLHKFNTLIIFSLDRFSREGILQSLNYIETLKANGVVLKSLTEPFIDTSDNGIGEVIIAILAWVAKAERVRIQVRTKAGMQRAKANGAKFGRKKGQKDLKKRNNSNYLLRWARERSKVEV